MIGHRWKRSNAWSLMILIGRGLDFKQDPRSKRCKERSEGKPERSESEDRRPIEKNQPGQNHLRRSCAVVRVRRAPDPAKSTPRREAERAEKRRAGKTEAPEPQVKIRRKRCKPSIQVRSEGGQGGRPQSPLQRERARYTSCNRILRAKPLSRGKASKQVHNFR